MDSRTPDDAVSCLSDQSEGDDQTLSKVRRCAPAAAQARTAVATLTQSDVDRMIARHQYSEDIRSIVSG